MSSHVELERWMRQVRVDTHHEWQRGHAAKGKLTEQGSSPIEQRLQRAGQWFGRLRHATHEGLPAVERLIVRLVNPHVAPERLLPDSSLPRL